MAREQSAGSRKVLLTAVLILAPLIVQSQPDPQVDAAWAALRQGDGGRAAAAFELALRRRPRDPGLLLGAGAAARLLGRDHDAIEFLASALAIDPKLTQASELLGEIEYSQGDLEGAIRRYEQALTHASKNAAGMRRRLEQWRKEAAVHDKLSERSEARFSVVFDGRSDSFLSNHAVALLERTFQRIGERIGAFPSRRILVTLYSEQQFQDITRVPAWSAGAFDGKIRIPVRGISQNMEQFDRVLVHELTHAMVHGLALRGVPAWLHEGLASYFEPGDVASAERRMQALGLVVPLADLQDSFSRFRAAQAVVAYDQSLVAADTLVRLVGTRMAGLLQGLGAGQTFEQSMAQLGFQAAEFEAQVSRRLRR